MQATEYHFLLLYPTKLRAMSRLSGEVVAEVPLPQGCLGIVRDPTTNALWLFTDCSVHQVLLDHRPFLCNPRLVPPVVLSLYSNTRC